VKPALVERLAAAVVFAVSALALYLVFVWRPPW
jgi:hypothetical protein